MKNIEHAIKEALKELNTFRGTISQESFEQKFGTIENMGFKQLSNGPIIYRFMAGDLLLEMHHSTCTVHTTDILTGKVFDGKDFISVYWRTPEAIVQAMKSKNVTSGTISLDKLCSHFGYMQEEFKEEKLPGFEEKREGYVIDTYYSPLLEMEVHYSPLTAITVWVNLRLKS